MVECAEYLRERRCGLRTAIRTRRASLGWSPDIIVGGGAAALETGVPRLTMSMLIRAGLPSRRAAIAAVDSSNAAFTTPAEMREWLASNEIAAFTDQGNWPTPETAALWKRFRTDALSGGIQKWTIGSWKRLLDVPEGSKDVPEGPYRILPNDEDSRTWLVTPDYQPIAPFKKPVPDIKPSLLSGRLSGKTLVVDASRLGRGKVKWPQAGQD